MIHSAVFVLAPGAMAALLAVALAAGVGITAVGPGGVLLTIGLFALTVLPPASVAGTGIVTNVATGLLGAAAYLRSGHLRAHHTRRIAILLSFAAVPGTPLGIWLNGHTSRAGFGLLLGGLTGATGVMVALRLRRAVPLADAHPRVGDGGAALLGFAVSVVSGLFGLGGPMLAVPLLLAVGVPILPAIAAAQVQSVAISGIGAVGYAAHGAIDWAMALLVGVPEMAGVVLGWQLARRLPARALAAALAAGLIALAPYLVWRSG